MGPAGGEDSKLRNWKWSAEKIFAAKPTGRQVAPRRPSRRLGADNDGDDTTLNAII